MNLKQMFTIIHKDKKSKKDLEQEVLWRKQRDEECFKRCSPNQLQLDGKYTKLLKAFAQLFGLVHVVELGKTNFGLGLEVNVYVKNKWYESALDVFEIGKVAIVSYMREYTQDALPYTVEDFSKKILEGTFGKDRYIRSFKGGDGYTIVGDHLEPVPQTTIYDLPRTMEELLVRLDVAGIDWQSCKIELKKANI